MSVGQLDIQDPCFPLCAWHMHTSDFVTEGNRQSGIFKPFVGQSLFVREPGHVTAQFWPRNFWRVEDELEYCSMNKGEVANIGAQGGNENWSLLFTLNGGRNMGRVAVGRLVISPLGVALTPKLGSSPHPSLPFPLRTPRLLKRNVCMFHMSPPSSPLCSICRHGVLYWLKSYIGFM